MESLLTGHPTAIFWHYCLHGRSVSLTGDRCCTQRKRAAVPDSKDTLGPWYATQDTLIATANDQSKLVRYNFKTQKWSDILSSPDKFVNWMTSPDGKYFYYSTGGSDPTVFRLRLSDDAVEEVLKLKNVRLVSDFDIGPKLASPRTTPSLCFGISAPKKSMHCR